MELRKILDEKIIRIGLDVKSKDDALKEMGDMLYQNGYINDTDQFIKDIYLREEEGATGIGNNVAIPHGKSKSVTKIGIAIATLKEGIEWETLDGDKVNIIFLFCVSDDMNSNRDHLVLLSRVAGKLADDDLLLKIKTAQSACDIVTYLGGE
ncbi:fructose PTS transporter subunit IIA [Irregularibacter muris]|uniref:Fructose PTS transporter subunit IIA n=1 Tax=Irregularibacter muris TaxID=1796619 RepID=A0AAE3L2W0_9FIRM|nr:fructose PTS transporter subunit IIA [Irregularibacter muris]MCR1899399.1 fructose PTS transporter subunit IIA [Irregularibacter muris]